MTTQSKPLVPPSNGSIAPRTSRQADRSARFWNRIAQRYARKPVPNEKAYAHKLALTREYLHPDSSVLELGCGTGATALAHAPFVRHIRATDFSSSMIEIAGREATAAAIDNVEFVCRDVFSAGEPGQTYDAVLALNVLHLLADWSETIRSAHRSLKSGGVFITSTVCLRDSHAYLQPIASVGRRVGLLPRLGFIARSDLIKAMSDTGFTVEHVWQPAPKQALFAIARKRS